VSGKGASNGSPRVVATGCIPVASSWPAPARPVALVWSWHRAVDSSGPLFGTSSSDGLSPRVFTARFYGSARFLYRVFPEPGAGKPPDVPGPSDRVRRFVRWTGTNLRERRPMRDAHPTRDSH